MVSCIGIVNYTGVGQLMIGSAQTEKGWKAEMKVGDYCVTWNEVNNLVDKFIEDHDAKIAMGDIEREVRHAWDILYDNLCRKYGEACYRD